MLCNLLGSAFFFFFSSLSLSWILCFLFSTPPKTSALPVSPCEGVVFISKGGLSPLTDDEKCLQAESRKNSIFILCGHASCQFHYPCVHQDGHWRDEQLILVLGGKAIFDGHFFLKRAHFWKSTVLEIPFSKLTSETAESLPLLSCNH